jgi:hypothetical protein
MSTICKGREKTICHDSSMPFHMLSGPPNPCFLAKPFLHDEVYDIAILNKPSDQLGSVNLFPSPLLNRAFCRYRPPVKEVDSFNCPMHKSKNMIWERRWWWPSTNHLKVATKLCFSIEDDKKHIRMPIISTGLCIERGKAITVRIS